MRGQLKEATIGRFVEEMKSITSSMTQKYPKLIRYVTKTHIFSFMKQLGITVIDENDNFISRKTKIEMIFNFKFINFKSHLKKITNQLGKSL